MKGCCPDWGKTVGTFSIFSNYTVCTAKSCSQGWYLNTGSKTKTHMDRLLRKWQTISANHSSMSIFQPVANQCPLSLKMHWKTQAGSVQLLHSMHLHSCASVPKHTYACAHFQMEVHTDTTNPAQVQIFGGVSSPLHSAYFHTVSILKIAEGLWLSAQPP